MFAERNSGTSRRTGAVSSCQLPSGSVRRTLRAILRAAGDKSSQEEPFPVPQCDRSHASHASSQSPSEVSLQCDDRRSEQKGRRISVEILSSRRSKRKDSGWRFPTPPERIQARYNRRDVKSPPVRAGKIRARACLRTACVTHAPPDPGVPAFAKHCQPQLRQSRTFVRVHPIARSPTVILLSGVFLPNPRRFLSLQPFREHAPQRSAQNFKVIPLQFRVDLVG